MLPPNVPDKCQRKWVACAALRVRHLRALCHRRLPRPSTPIVPDFLCLGRMCCGSKTFYCGDSAVVLLELSFVSASLSFSPLRNSLRKNSCSDLQSRLWCSAATVCHVPAYCVLASTEPISHSVTFYNESLFFSSVYKKSRTRTVFMSNRSQLAASLLCHYCSSFVSRPLQLVGGKRRRIAW